MDIFDFISEKIEQGQSLILATVVNNRGSSPADVGKKMALAADGSTAGTVGGGPLEAKVVEEAKHVLADKKPRLLRFRLDARKASELGMLCGGEQEVFLDAIGVSPRIMIFGGGHIGLALTRVASAIDFPFSVADDRDEFISRKRFSRARRLTKLSFEDSWEGLGIDKDTFVVIFTRGHLFDQICLEKAINTAARYIGMIGSRNKVQKVFSALEAKGVKVREDSRVYAPMGLDLGDKSPEEIALSIMAEILAVKSGKSGRHMREILIKKDDGREPERL